MRSPKGIAAWAALVVAGLVVLIAAAAKEQNGHVSAIFIVSCLLMVSAVGVLIIGVGRLTRGYQQPTPTEPPEQEEKQLFKKREEVELPLELPDGNKNQEPAFTPAYQIIQDLVRLANNQQTAAMQNHKDAAIERKLLYRLIIQQQKNVYLERKYKLEADTVITLLNFFKDGAFSSISQNGEFCINLADGRIVPQEGLEPGELGCFREIETISLEMLPSPRKPGNYDS